MPQQKSTSQPIQYNKENINEPSSFESSDSKSRMLLNNFPSGKIVNEPYQALLDKLPCTAKLCNEPGEKVKTFSSARLSEKSKDFLDNEPHQATLDELPRTAKLYDEPGEKVKTFSSARLSEKSKNFLDNKRRKPYIITKKIVYESCAIGCKWYMIYK
jgi:hypothetical protein